MPDTGYRKKKNMLSADVFLNPESWVLDSNILNY